MDYETEQQVKNLVKDLYYQDEYAGDVVLIADEVESQLNLQLDEQERIDLELLVEQAIEEVQDSEGFEFDEDFEDDEDEDE